MSDEARAASGIPLKSRTRAVVIGLVVLCALPTVVAAATHGPVPMAAEAGSSPPSLEERPNLTAVAVQGGEVGDGSDSRVLLFDPDTGTAQWERTTYETYYDVDPLGDSRLLYVGMTDDDATYAVEHDWRTDERRELFTLPFDSHDVDSLGDGEYAYVDGKNDTAVVYDARTDSIVWEYDFKRHFPPSAGNGPPGDYSGDYTHLNDVDAVANGSKFLLSPRNFDRVMLVDRETKRVEWTLGEEDDYDVLNQQHNPTLLSTDPPTVLVADSENDRIVEYRRTGGEWQLVWEYRDDLVWPRDADRLPNGNTLIVDSYGAREVTPGRETVWRAEIPRFVYDAERVRLGDEPGGPSMAEYREAFDGARDDRRGGAIAPTVERAYSGVFDTVYWVLPWWLGGLEFALLLPAVALLAGWLNVEARDALGGSPNPSSEFRWPSMDRLRGPRAGATLAAAGGLVLVTGILDRLVLGSGATTGPTFWEWGPAYVTVALLLTLEGVGLGVTTRRTHSRGLAWVHRSVAVATITTGIVFGTVGTLGSLGYSEIAAPASLLAFSSVLVFGLGSLASHARGPSPFLRDGWALPAVETAGRTGYLAGVSVVAAGLFVLGQGLQSAIFPLSYLALSFGLLLDGDRLVGAAIPHATDRPGVASGLAVFRYVLRPVWLALAGALGAKILGAGAMGSVMANLHLFNPVTIGFAVFVAARIADRVGPEVGTPVAVPAD